MIASYISNRNDELLQTSQGITFIGGLYFNSRMKYENNIGLKRFFWIYLHQTPTAKYVEAKDV